MKSLALFVSFLLLASVPVPAAELTATDIAELKKICGALVGARTGSDGWGSALQKLRGYAASPAVFKMFHFVCEGSRCSGTLALRDSSEVFVSFAQSRDYDPVGSGRIDTVLLRNHGRILFSAGDVGRDSDKRSDRSL